MGTWTVATWLRLAAAYGAASISQDARAITGPEGWLKYLSKHASRGVAHYQRQGKPAGWESTGRLWGKGGDWPIGEPLKVTLEGLAFHRWRRLVRSYVIAEARTAALATRPGTDEARRAWRRVSRVRSMLRNNDRGRSAARGVGEWMPGQAGLELALLAGWSGELVAA
ncbi:hypothetical protein [Nocardioides sp. MH1]|uniref:hypothetical protein n=1 Tax=Nocardioides sp. MH1 TaxID=3242490 RepID=UPI0035218C40